MLKVAKQNFARSAWFAWFLCGLIGILTLINVGLSVNNRPVDDNLIKGFSDIFWGITPITLAIVSALITSRQPRNRIGRLLMIPAIYLVLYAPLSIYTTSYTAAPPQTIYNLVITWIESWAWMLFIFPLFLILLLFPTGNPPSPRWRWISTFTWGWAAFFILMVTFSQNLHEENDVWMLPNPIGLIPEQSAFYSIISAIFDAGLVLMVVSCTTALFVRFHRAAAVERTQIKWLLYAAGIFIVVFIPINVWLSKKPGLPGDVSDLLLILSIMLFPLTIVIAILRYRLWDIDVIIRKTLIYSVLTAFLALIFFGSVTLLQQAVNRIVGTEDSPFVIILSTLMIAALFTPLRRVIQNNIDRRFYRKNYDIQKILDQFTRTIRVEVEADEVGKHLIAVVDETLQPERIGLWLLPRKKG